MSLPECRCRKGSGSGIGFLFTPLEPIVTACPVNRMAADLLAQFINDFINGLTRCLLFLRLKKFQLLRCIRTEVAEADTQ